MKISVLTLFPDIYEPFFTTSIVKKAVEKGLISYQIHNLLSLAEPKKRIDDTTFGHNAGMLIRPDIIEQGFAQADKQFGRSLKIFFSPQGKKLNQHRLQVLYERAAQAEHIALFASRYEGVDARVEQEYADEVISIGDFVVMGGDLPAMLLLEGLLRFVPGVVGKQESVQKDSFSGAFVDYPEYTKPVEWHGLIVPEILRSGNHAAIEQWRAEQAAHMTVKNHFNWFRSVPVAKSDISLAKKYIPAHYCVLLHHDMNLKEGRIGATSVTSIDVHDIARSSATYGLKNYFIATPLIDQQRIVNTMLTFWHDDAVGGSYNASRASALQYVRLVSHLDEVIAAIKEVEGKEPLLIGTSARLNDGKNHITYFDQQEVFKHDRPVLFLFGTGNGMSDQLLERCDYMLPPLQGLSSFNHLSVRSAAAIIFDKWLGLCLQR